MPSITKMIPRRKSVESISDDDVVGNSGTNKDLNELMTKRSSSTGSIMSNTIFVPTIHKGPLRYRLCKKTRVQPILNSSATNAAMTATSSSATSSSDASSATSGTSATAATSSSVLDDSASVASAPRALTRSSVSTPALTTLASAASSADSSVLPASARSLPARSQSVRTVPSRGFPKRDDPFLYYSLSQRRLEELRYALEPLEDTSSDDESNDDDTGTYDLDFLEDDDCAVEYEGADDDDEDEENDENDENASLRKSRLSTEVHHLHDGILNDLFDELMR